MKMVVAGLLLVSAVGASEEYSSNVCKVVMARYEIDPDIKSTKGWRRVANNDNLQDYTDVYILEKDKDILGKCLAKEGFDIESYKRTIGGL